MSKNLTRKGLALGTALTFGLTGLVGIAAPAYAAGEVVSIAPTTGTGFAAYDTDYLSTTAKFDANTYVADIDQLAINIDNADKLDISLKLDDGLAGGTHTEATQDTCTYTLPVTLRDDLGNSLTPSVTAAVNVDDAATSNAACTDAVGADAAFTVDFTAPGASTLNFNHAILDLSGLAGRSVAVSAKVAATSSAAISLTAWLDIDDDELLETSDKYPSTTEKVSFYDPSAVSISPRVERFVYDSNGATANGETNVFNADDETALGVSLAFSPALNLDQVVLSNLSFVLTEDGTEGASAETFTGRGLFAISNYSKAGKIYGTISTCTADVGVSNKLDAASSYVVAVTKENGATDVVARTGGYAVPAQQSTSINVAAFSSIAATAAVDNKQTDSTTDTFALRTGVKSFTYTTTADAEKANVPALVTVQAKTLATGGSITVNGTKSPLGEVAIVTGTTDAAGKFSVTVASDLAATGEQYIVTFYVADVNGAWVAFDDYAATYASAAPTTVTPSSTIVAGTDVSVNFTVKDQFSQLVSTTTAGKALYIEAKATDTTKLKSYIAVTNGVATLAFKNYLLTGGTDSITWTLGTGANATDFVSASVATDTLSLYNPAAAAAVNAIANQTANITYDDFITGATSATNVAPDQSADVAISGTVVDANGAGIPGAVVTIAAKGLQFQKTGGDYYVDSISTTADAAGAFSVNVWAHTASSTGIPVTITSNGKTATTTLKTYLPSTGVNGNNLVFSWNLPEFVVKNTTYAVTAKLADKWGNPVATSTSTAAGNSNVVGNLGVSFQGNGSVEINSTSSAVTKNFDKSGSVTVFLRSVKDVAGPGSITATLGLAEYSATSAASPIEIAVTQITTDLTTTKWNETLFKNTLESNVEVLEVAPAPAASSNAAGSTGKFYASATNAAGKKVVVKVNGKFAKSFIGTAVKKVISVTASKGTKTITIYVGGKLSSTKVVIVK